jgi:hypothetical protein
MAKSVKTRNSAIRSPNTKRHYTATPALEKKLEESRDSKELDCPPGFFTQPDYYSRLSKRQPRALSANATRLFWDQERG